jgi:hypothetical protein
VNSLARVGNSLARALVLASLASALACPARAPSEAPVRIDDSDSEPEATSTGAVDPASDEGEGGGSTEPTFASCEGVCGGLHDCLLAEPDPTTSPHQAAALELDCLRQCVEGGPAVAGSRFAACTGAPRCAELLPCMRDAWPDVPSESIPEPIIEPSGSEGCRLGCKRLGECFGSKPDEVDACASGCERKLDPTQMKAFGECMEIADCTAMLECMIAFPGAGPSSS